MNDFEILFKFFFKIINKQLKLQQNIANIDINRIKNIINIQKNSKNLLYSKNIYQRDCINMLFIINQLTKKILKYNLFFFFRKTIFNIEIKIV